MLNSLSDLEILVDEGILGEGAFSEVFKVKLKKDGLIYALKKINISKLA